MAGEVKAPEMASRDGARISQIVKEPFKPKKMDYFAIRKQVKGDLQHSIAALMDLKQKARAEVLDPILEASEQELCGVRVSAMTQEERCADGRLIEALQSVGEGVAVFGGEVMGLQSLIPLGEVAFEAHAGAIPPALEQGERSQGLAGWKRRGRQG